MLLLLDESYEILPAGWGRGRALAQEGGSLDTGEVLPWCEIGERKIAEMSPGRWIMYSTSRVHD